MRNLQLVIDGPERMKREQQRVISKAALELHGSKTDRQFLYEATCKNPKRNPHRGGYSYGLRLIMLGVSRQTIEDFVGVLRDQLLATWDAHHGVEHTAPAPTTPALKKVA